MSQPNASPLPTGALSDLAAMLSDLPTSVRVAQERLAKFSGEQRADGPPAKQHTFLEKYTEHGPSRELLDIAASQNSFLSAVIHTPAQLACQLTLMQMELYVAIPARELTQCGWMKSDKWKRAPVTLNYIAHHNRCSWWCAQEIVQHEDDENRVALLRLMIDIAFECLQLGNFDTAFALFGGLSSTPVHRLRYTWQDIGSRHTKRWQELEDMASTDYNYRNYRTLYAKFVEKNAPRIPFLGVTLGDLVRIDTVLKSTVVRASRPTSSHGHTHAHGHGAARVQAPDDDDDEPSDSAVPRERSRHGPSQELINFHKHLTVYHTIQTVVKSQRSMYQLSGDLELQILLREGIMKSDLEDEHSLYDLSLQIEPRDKAERDYQQVVNVLSSAGL